MKKIRLILLFSSCLICGYNFAQDVIFTKDGAKLRCRIVMEDSATIYYLLPHQKTSLEIKKSNVLNYSRKKKEEPVALPISNSPSKRRTLRKEVLLLNFSGGVSNPLGDYASKDANSSTSGLATQGALFLGSMVLKLSPNIGVCAAYQYQLNGFASSSFNNALIAAAPGIDFTTTSTKWNIRGFYGGIYLTLPVKSVEGLSLFVNGYAGLPKYVTPQVITTGVNINTGVKAIITQDAASTSAFGLMGGGGLMYKFFDGFGLNLSANYFSGKADFSDVFIHSSTGTFSYQHFTQKFASLNVQAGITFIIN